MIKLLLCLCSNAPFVHCTVKYSRVMDKLWLISSSGSCVKLIMLISGTEIKSRLSGTARFCVAFIICTR